MKRITFFISILTTIALSVSLLHSPNATIAHTPDHPGATKQQTEHSAKMDDRAPLFNHLGSYHFPISSRNKLAQRYFDQGMILAYGFNHAEATRSFQAATKLDPNCAICHWGLALVLGPNINAGMDENAVPQAWQAIQSAQALSQSASPQEQAYIQALAQRYSAKPASERKPLDIAYANAMRQVVKQYPHDLDAATLFAEALMDTTPWDYWQENGDPKPEGMEIMATLESVLKRNPNHAGANHLYIHAVEKERPELGIAAADRLMKLVPGAGHLVHMASHIYIRVGRYHDAVVSNQLGIAADDAYVAACHAQGIYPLTYMPHNHHFLWYAALMTGQSQVAIDAAKQTAKVDEKMMRNPALSGALQHFYTIPLYTYTRFGKWDDILATPAPAPDLKYPIGVWHYARGHALLATGQPQQVQQELEQLRTIAADPALKEFRIWGVNPSSSVLEIGTAVLAAKLATAKGDYETAIVHLQQAIKVEASLTYTEPDDWYQPVHQMLGSVLLQAKRPQEAEQAFRQDLQVYPDNSWSLYGLAQSLQAQGKTQEAQVIQARFQRTWKYADVGVSALKF